MSRRGSAPARSIACTTTSTNSRRPGVAAPAPRFPTLVMSRPLDYRPGVIAAYPDVLTPDVREALEALAPFELERRSVMAARLRRRSERAREGRHIGFLDPDALIPRTSIRVGDARAGNFSGAEIPADLRRQWIQGTGPAT